MARLQRRKFGQAPTLLQAVSSHPHVFIIILWQSINFHPVKQLFQIAAAGDPTADPWVTSPTLSHYTTGTSCTAVISQIFPNTFWLQQIKMRNNTENNLNPKLSEKLLPLIITHLEGRSCCKKHIHLMQGHQNV